MALPWSTIALCQQREREWIRKVNDDERIPMEKVSDDSHLSHPYCSGKEMKKCTSV